MELKAPGLKIRPRKDGTTVYYWVAKSSSPKAKEYPSKSVRVHGVNME